MLDTAITSVGNTVFRDGLSAVLEDMLSGEGFAAPLDRTGLFPRIVIQMIKVGEETGNPRRAKSVAMRSARNFDAL